MRADLQPELEALATVPRRDRDRGIARSVTRPARGAVAIATLCFLAAGCHAGYIARVGRQHLRYLRSARPIEQVLAATVDADRRARLALVLEARAWAARHGLEVGGSYARVADTGGLATTYVVTAARPDRLEPYEWRYPFVGRMPYRGYFRRQKADRFAARLAARGLDTYVVEASGYSTLGWFDDPLPSGVLEQDRVGIVTFLFHELLHQTLFVPGKIAFNETLASAVSHRLTGEFFTESGDQEALHLLRERSDRWLEQAQLCEVVAEQLRSLFATARNDAELEARSRIYRSALPELRRLRLVGAAADGAGDPTLNNAWFLAIWRYRRGAQLLVGYLDHFESVTTALADLEIRLQATEDPWEAVTVGPGARSPRDRD